MPAKAVVDDLRPHEIAIPFDDGVRSAVLERLLGKERGVNAAEDDPRAALARQPSDFVAAPRVAGVDADADHVAAGDRVELDPIECLVNEMWITHSVGVAAASTYSHRGVMTATPNDTWLGLIR